MSKKNRRQLGVNGDKHIENLAYRQIADILIGHSYKFSLYQLRNGAYGITIYDTSLDEFLKAAVQAAKDGARVEEMNSGMIDAIKIRPRPTLVHVYATDVWIIEMIVRQAIKRKLRSIGSATS